MRTPHSLAAYVTEENLAVLDDGSRWAVYSGFDSIIRQWEPDQMIMVKKSKDREYPYKLVNVHLQESVEAKPLTETN